jgi:hypothetical protein
MAARSGSISLSFAVAQHHHAPEAAVARDRQHAAAREPLRVQVRAIGEGQRDVGQIGRSGWMGPVDRQRLDAAPAAAARLHHQAGGRGGLDQADADEVGVDDMAQAADRVDRHLGQVDRVEDRAVDPRHRLQGADLARQARRHGVEGTGQMAEFVGAPDLDRAAEVALGQAPRALQQFADRRDDQAYLVGRQQQHGQQAGQGHRKKGGAEGGGGGRRVRRRLQREHGQIGTGQPAFDEQRPLGDLLHLAVDGPGVARGVAAGGVATGWLPPAVG